MPTETTIKLQRPLTISAATTIRATHGFATAQCALGGIAVSGRRRSRRSSLAPGEELARS
jgi:hypothetical protein